MFMKQGGTRKDAVGLRNKVARVDLKNNVDNTRLTLNARRTARHLSLPSAASLPRSYAGPREE